MNHNNRSGYFLQPISALLHDHSGFWSAAPAFEIGQTRLLKEGPRLLLEKMLEIPAVRADFLRRGLLPRLTHELASAVEGILSEVGRARFSDGNVAKPKADKIMPPFEADGETAMRMSGGECISSRSQHDITMNYQRSNAHESRLETPARCLPEAGAGMASRGECRSCPKAGIPAVSSPGHTVPWWLFVPGGESLTSGDDHCVDWEAESERYMFGGTS